MNDAHTVGTREEWTRARLELLEAEKDLYGQRARLAQQRRALPWVPVEQAYAFDGLDGRVTLPDLFDSCRRGALCTGLGRLSATDSIVICAGDRTPD